jgi:hypothetical protein
MNIMTTIVWNWIIHELIELFYGADSCIAEASFAMKASGRTGWSKTDDDHQHQNEIVIKS